MNKFVRLANKIIQTTHVDKKKSNGFYYLHRVFSVPITILFLSLGVSANFVSVLMILLTFIGYFSLYFFDVYWYGFLFLIFAFFLDKVDGDIARFTNTTDDKSVIFDLVYHRLSLIALFHGTALFVDPTDARLHIIALVAVVVANIIEEIQMFPYRIFGQKYLSGSISDKKSMRTSQVFFSPLFFKLFNLCLKFLRLFRHQIFLFYIFGFVMFVMEGLMGVLLSICLINLLAAFVLQACFTYFIDYDNRLNKLKV